ncbi:MAG: arylsulfatase [Gemmatimonadetes bacterium]|nr:arylsulfatase [Gemmatimonadota bacterium]|tara:strand:- start:2251 stop:3729 length:1479 start_codon:yes stop_codon:yes gene_type:complete
MSDQPNVLIVCTDHWPGSLFGVAGHPVIQTPTLDQLARNGCRFPRAYSECPVCIPARRTLMTGTTTRTHGDREFAETLRMPDLPTIAQTFRDAGYQAFAAGKLHVYPQRDRIGFDDVILHEEGRAQFDAVDDYELFLGDQGYAGRMFAHGMNNNDYLNRPWHLPEHCHVTNWTTQQMARLIQRRDPTKPGFYYLSYCHPHPPLTPLPCYAEMYRELEPDEPFIGSWAEDLDALPFALQTRRNSWDGFTEEQIRSARRAFYGMCTHIDHQLRIVLGTLREERLLDNTIICFTSDHGDMLGNHQQWAKRLYYENSAQVPMILVGTANDDRVGHHRVDDRLVGWQDVMPTLLDLTGVEIPDSVEGRSMVGENTRPYLYGEVGNGATATRMMHDGRHKLIYYPVGNCAQLFDLENDPNELTDLIGQPAYSGVEDDLKQRLSEELYGGDEAWVQEGHFVGLPDQAYTPGPNRGLTGQRGSHWPVPPQTGEGDVLKLS